MKTNNKVTIRNIGLADLIDNHIIWLFENGKDKAVKIKNLLYCEYLSTPKEATVLTYREEDTEMIRQVSSSDGIGKWEEKLGPLGFCRVHRGFLLNYQHIEYFHRQKKMVKLQALSKEFPVSRTGKEKLLIMMQAIVG